MTAEASVWKTLSSIDVKPFLIEKDGTPILPHMRAHALTMEHYPTYSWQFIKDERGRDIHYLEDGSGEVKIKMTIDDLSHEYSIPIYRPNENGQTQAINNPSAWDLNTAKQRLRVRALGLFGLGWELWLDGDTPMPAFSDSEPPPEEVAESDNEIAEDLWEQAGVQAATNLKAFDRKVKRYQTGLRNHKIDDDPKADQIAELRQGFHH
tara:strand:+ start:120 stop:743 length:624 start_codon:yes stop_codon:yes gene_type:complete